MTHTIPVADRDNHSPRTHLQNPATDVPVTGLALDAKLGMVVGLTVWDAIPLGEGEGA